MVLYVQNNLNLKVNIWSIVLLLDLFETTFSLGLIGKQSSWKILIFSCHIPYTPGGTSSKRREDDLGKFYKSLWPFAGSYNPK